MELELPDEARALLDAVVAIGSDLDLHGVLRRIVESSCALTHAQYGVLAIVDDEGTFVDLVAHGMSDEVIERIGRAPVGRGLLGFVPRVRKLVRVDHLAEHPSYEGLPAGHPPIERFLGAPVLVGDRIYGHLYLGNGPEADAFTARDDELVQVFGRAAGVMISHARQFEESERHRTWMQGVARVATALAPSLQDDHSLNAMADQVREMAEARSVVLVDTTTERLEIVASACADDEDLTLTVKRYAEQVQQATATGELVDIRSVPGQATLVVPVRTDLAPAAAVIVDGSVAWRELESVERAVIATLADHIGLTLDRAEALRERHELLLAKDRDRIARDLHDLVIQRLFATGMQLQGARNLAPETMRARVDEAVVYLDTAITDLRSTIFELGRGGGRGYHEEVRALISEYAPVLGFLPALRLSGQVDRSLTPDAADGLLLTLRETLSNISRHAKASRATIELAASSRWVTLRVSDDGEGFDPALVERRSGLDNARHRAETLGGSFSIEQAEGGGTRAVWTVPALA
ncbi:GAF domain-containing protein [Nocardioides humilatus]|uniref:GAF domain-containing protein n=1 Tax=Nocardioides humilatus TaxID=2607660 RepID=A0A5B1LB74_9ACTN|nr:GAF domain-containing protein [Nocardioides humilatus]KAA1417686.1 GAF domain-containing protein [Nocardioides humilatus]